MSTIERPVVPEIDFQCSPPRGAPGESFFPRLDELREAHPVFRSTEAQGYWVFTRAKLIVEVMQNPEIFSSSASVPPTQPNPAFTWIPLMLDPPEHTKWRRLLGGWFSPGRVASLEGGLRERCRSLIDAVADKGQCDLIDDFAGVFPTSVFLQILGLPPTELRRYLVWEEAILQWDVEIDPDFSKATQAMLDVQNYFQGIIDLRRNDPSTRGDDLITASLEWEIDGEKIPDKVLKNCLLLLFMAGLDTVTMQISFMFHHLATHPADRQKLVDDPTLIPRAVEELLRFYSITRAGRKVAKDVEFHGYSLKAGDMIYMPLVFAGRDEATCPMSNQVDFEREPFKNYAFGAGPHRCVGAHLARRELIIAIEEWLKTMPDFRIPDGAEIVQHAGQVYGLDSLPVQWDLPAGR